MAYSGPVPNGGGEEAPVTVCIFDHPDNPGYPARWFARPYGLVAANPFAATAFEDSDSLKRLDAAAGFRIPGYDTAVLTYRVAVAKGELGPEDIELLWEAFTGATTEPANGDA